MGARKRRSVPAIVARTGGEALTHRTFRLAVIALASLGICGCAAAGDGSTSAAPHGGSIEFAVTETCAVGSDPQCISAGDQHVIRPDAFAEAAVEDVVASSDAQQNAVDITLTDSGANILEDLTTEASGADTESRLVVKAGDEILAAVAVREPLSGENLALGFAPEDDVDAVVKMIQGN